MPRVRSTGGTGSGLHQVNNAKGKSKVTKARVGRRSGSISKVKGKKTRFKGLSKLVNKLKVHKRGVQHHKVETSNKNYGPKTAEALDVRNQKVQALNDAEKRAESSMERASASSSRQDTAREADEWLEKLTNVMTEQGFDPEILVSMQSLRTQIGTQKANDIQLHTEAEQQAETALSEMKGIETKLATDAGHVKKAFEDDRSERITGMVNAQFDKAMNAARKKEAEIQGKKKEFGDKKDKNQKALEAQNQEVRQLLNKKVKVTVALDAAKALQKETDKYFGKLGVLSEGLKFLEGMDVGPKPGSDLSKVLDELHPDGKDVSAEDAISAVEDNVNSLSTQLGLKMEKATRKQATNKERLTTARTKVKELIKAANQQVTTLEGERKDLVKEEKELQRKIKKDRSALATELAQMSKTLDGEIRQYKTELRGLKRELKENIPGFEVAKAPKKGRFTQTVKTQMAQEFSQKAAVAQEPGQEPLYAQPNKQSGTAARYDYVDEKSDDSGRGDEFRDDDFDGYGQASQPPRTGVLYENVKSDDADIGDDYRDDDDAEPDSVNGEQYSSSAPPLPPRRYSQFSTDLNAGQTGNMTIDMVSQGVLDYFENSRESLYEVFRGESWSDDERQGALNSAVTQLKDDLMKSGLISDQNVAARAAYDLVMSEGKSFEAIKDILEPLVR